MFYFDWSILTKIFLKKFYIYWSIEKKMQKNFLREVILQMVQNEELPKNLSPNLILPPKISSNPPISKQNQITCLPHQKGKPKKNNETINEIKETKQDTEDDSVEPSGSEIELNTEIDEIDAVELRKMKRRLPESEKKKNQIFVEKIGRCDLCFEECPESNLIGVFFPTGIFNSCSTCFNLKYKKSENVANEITSFCVDKKEFKSEINDLKATSLVVTPDEHFICGNENLFEVYHKNKKLTEIKLDEKYNEIKHINNDKFLFSNFETSKAMIFDVKEKKEISNLNFIFKSRQTSNISIECFKCKKLTNTFHTRRTPVGVVEMCEDCEDPIKKPPTTSTLIANEFDNQKNELKEIKQFKEHYDDIFAFPDQNIIFLRQDSSYSVYNIEKEKIINHLILENEKIVEIKLDQDFFQLITTESSISYEIPKNYWLPRIPLKQYQDEFLDKQKFANCCRCKKFKKFIEIQTLIGPEKCCFFCLNSCIKNEKIQQIETFEYNPEKKEILNKSKQIYSDYDYIDVISSTNFLGINEDEIELKKDNKIIQIHLKKKYTSIKYDSKRNQILAKNQFNFDIIDLKGNIVKNFILGKEEIKKQVDYYKLAEEQKSTSLKRKLESDSIREKKRRKKLEKVEKVTEKKNFDDFEEDDDESN